LKVLFVSSEVAPFAKTGGLGDVAAALPKALRAAGHDVRVVMPLYSRVKDADRERLEVAVREVVLTLGSNRVVVSVLAHAAEGVSFVRCPGLYGRPGI
jgi:starch synthase